MLIEIEEYGVGASSYLSDFNALPKIEKLVK